MTPTMLQRSGLIFLFLMLASCATDDLLGRKPTATQNLTEADKTLQENPADKSARIQKTNAEYKRINELVGLAEQASKDGNLDEARAQYESVLRLDPENVRARQALQLIDNEIRHQAVLADARSLFEAGNTDAARTRLRPVLIENPGQREARLLMREIEDKSYKDQITPRKLKPPKGKTITLEFRDANLRDVFDVISRTSGINFVLDPSLRPDLKSTIFVKDASVEESIDFLLMMHQLGKKVLTENSLLIYPQNKAGQYEDLTLRTYYLNYADAKQTAAFIKSMLSIKDIYIDDKLNMISMKAPFDQLQNVDKLIADSDIAEPEVMLDVEVLEVKRSRLDEIGIKYPDTFAVLGGSGPEGAFTWYDLKNNINSSTVGVSPAPAIRLLRTDGGGDLLANPRIRVKNREKAKIHIGNKIPIFNTTIASGNSSFASTSANYTDVGLKLDVEPRVMLNNDVSIKLNLEVSNVVETVQSSDGTKFPVIGSRNTSTILMSADNETQVLAGLINDEERKTAQKVPWLGDIPLLGRLFSNNTDDGSKTEIVLMITPHVVRNVARPEARNAEFYGGTGSGRSTPNINPTAILQQMTGVPQKAAPAPNAAPAAQPASGDNKPAHNGEQKPDNSFAKPLGQSE